MPNVIDHEDLYNVIVLGGVTSPGQVTLSGHDSNVSWDVRTGPYLVGATTTFRGKPPVEFTATFYLVKDVTRGTDDFAKWPAFQALIDSTVSGATPKALPIYHPDLASNKINSVVKSSVGGMFYDGLGGGIVVVKFQQYAPPRIQGGTLKGSSNEPDPNADVKAQLKALTDQYQATPWG